MGWQYKLPFCLFSLFLPNHRSTLLFPKQAVERTMEVRFLKTPLWNGHVERFGRS
jgi:hypothetical protein